jgi:signal transduction histidine kinase
MMTKLTLFFFLTSSFLFGQDQKAIDDLRKELKKDLPDSTKIDLMWNVAWASFRALPEKSIELSRECLALSKKTKNFKYESRSNNTIGAAYSFLGKYDSSDYYYNRSLSLGLKLNDSTMIAKGYGNLGLNFYYQGVYEKSIENYFKALKINELRNNKANMGNDCANLGNTYIQLGSLDLADKYLRRAFDLFEKVNNKQGMANSLSSLASVYTDVDSLMWKAKDLYARSYKLKEELNDRFGMCNVLHQLGYIAANEKNYNKAQEYNLKALKIRRELEDINGATTSIISIGNAYVSLKRPKEALPYLNEGLIFASQTGNADHRKHLYMAFSDAYADLKDFERSLKYRTLYSQVSDSLLNETKTEQIIEMQTKYETEKKEKENSELKRKTEIQQLVIANENQKRKNQLTIALTIIILIIGISLFIYNRKKQQQKTELAEAEKLRFKDVIEAEEKERSRIAQELHDGLGQLLSTARLNVAGLEDSVIKEDKPDLDRALKIIDDACIELRSISHNMMPSALIRLGLIPAINELVNNVNATKALKIDLTSNVDSSLGKSLDITVFRVIQEVLTNMIKHAKADHITISINKNSSELEISMKDNGIGFDTDKLKDSRGMGWKNIFSRVSMLDGSIKLESEPKKGTFVYINLKLKNG